MDKKKIHESDILSDYFRDNLKDIQIPVNQKCWDNISNRLIQKKRRLLFTRTITGIAAALLLVLTIYGIGEYQREQPEEVYSFISSVQPTVQKTIQPTAQPLVRPFIQPYVQKAVSSGSRPEVAGDTIRYNNEKSMLASVITLEPEKPSNPVMEVSDEVKTPSTYDSRTAFVNDSEEKERHNNWGISASFQTSGAQSTGQEQLRASSALIDNSQILTSYHDKTKNNRYATPFSVSIMLSNRVSERFSIETGLVYSYLSTTFKTQHEISPQTLKLHYIGVPVNIMATLVEITPHCKIYMSIGAMLEKGLAANNIEDTHMLDGPVARKSKIEGVQLSLSASAGISYKLIKNWALYMEPHLSYYFDNNQPLSIRTAHRTIPSINTGLRYEF